MDTPSDIPPAKRRKTHNPPPRETGLMRKSHQENGSATFLGSSSGIYFIRVVYNAFARRSAHLNQAQQSPPKDSLVPGEDDQLQHQRHRQDASQTLKHDLWTPHELDHHRPAKFTIDHLVQWTRSYFDHWHPIFPYLLAPTFLRMLETLSTSNGWSKLTTPEAILVRSIVSISLMDRRQMTASAASGAKSQPVPASLVFRTVDQAMQSLHTLFCDAPTIPTLQAAFSVQLFLASLLRLNAASRIGGVVTRTAFHLGLHRCPARYSCFTPEEAAIRRRLFWSIYCLERYLSQALGIPLSIRDDDVDVCYPSIETHADHVPDNRLRLLTHLAKFARVRGLIVELRNKSLAHSQASPTATQINGELTHWWNEVYDDVHLLDNDNPEDDRPPALAPLHRLLLIVLRHESIISMNRPLLATEPTSPEYKTALQVCIESSRELIAELRRHLTVAPVVPLVWPSFTWAVWMSCLILVYAAWEGEFAIAAASRYTKSGLLILQNLALRDSSWPQTCIEALRDLESALSNPPTSQQEQPTVFTDQSQQLPAMDTGLEVSAEHTMSTVPDTNQYSNPSVIFGDSNNPFFSGFSADGLLSGDSGVEGMLSDLWTVADGPWLIQENYDTSGL